jgi:hypothetical protein
MIVQESFSSWLDLKRGWGMMEAVDSGYERFRDDGRFYVKFLESHGMSIIFDEIG